MNKPKLPSSKDTKYAALSVELSNPIFFDDDVLNVPLIPNNGIKLREDCPVGRSPIRHFLHAFRGIINIKNLFYLDKDVNSASGRWGRCKRSYRPLLIRRTWSQIKSTNQAYPRRGVSILMSFRSYLPKIVGMVHNNDTTGSWCTDVRA